MDIGSMLEAGMMLCWGSSWPFQVAKTYTTKNVKGKSILFLWLINTGYVLGIAYKAFFRFDYVIWLYLLNFVFVFTDLVLYYRYKNLPDETLIIKESINICEKEPQEKVREEVLQ